MKKRRRLKIGDRIMFEDDLKCTIINQSGRSRSWSSSIFVVFDHIDHGDKFMYDKKSIEESIEKSEVSFINDKSKEEINLILLKHAEI